MNAVNILKDCIKRHISKREILDNVQFPRMELPNIDWVDCIAVLDHLVSKVQERYPRYHERFHDGDATANTKTILEENLKPYVREVCHSGLLGIDR